MAIENGNAVLWEVEGEEGYMPESIDSGSGATNPMAISSIGH